MALRQSAYIKGGLIGDFQLQLLLRFSSERGGQAQSTPFPPPDVRGRVGLTGPLEQLTLSSHSIPVTSAHSLPGSQGPESLPTALDLCISLPAELNPVSAPAQPSS